MPVQTAQFDNAHQPCHGRKVKVVNGTLDGALFVARGTQRLCCKGEHRGLISVTGRAMLRSCHFQTVASIHRIAGGLREHAAGPPATVSPPDAGCVDHCHVTVHKQAARGPPVPPPGCTSPQGPRLLRTPVAPRAALFTGAWLQLLGCADGLWLMLRGLSLQVTVDGGKDFVAKVLGQDEDKDVAVLQVEEKAVRAPPHHPLPCSPCLPLRTTGLISVFLQGACSHTVWARFNVCVHKSTCTRLHMRHRGGGHRWTSPSQPQQVTRAAECLPRAAAGADTRPAAAPLVVMFRQT